MKGPEGSTRPSRVTHRTRVAAGGAMTRQDAVDGPGSRQYRFDIYSPLVQPSGLRRGSAFRGKLRPGLPADGRCHADVVRLAREGALDVAVLFSQDQDLSEVADEVRAISIQQRRWIKVACAFPVSPTYANTRGVNKTTGSASTAPSTTGASTAPTTAREAGHERGHKTGRARCRGSLAATPLRRRAATPRYRNRPQRGEARLWRVSGKKSQ
jgi:hypothetical protein